MILHQGPISGVAVFEDTYVATAGYDNQLILWDLRSGTSLGRSCHDHLANQCAFRADGKFLVSASSDYTARVWSVPDLRLCGVLNDHRDDVEMAVFHPSKDLIATASRDRHVRVFTSAGELLHRFGGHDADALSVQWVAGSTDLISSGDDGTVRRWSLDRLQQTECYDLGGVETDTIVVSPDGSIFAGTDDGDIVVFSGSESGTTPAHAAGVKRLAYSDRSRLLASVSYDRTVKIWSAASHGLEIVATSELPPDVWARACSFGPGTTVVFGTFGGRYREYDYASGGWSRPAPTTDGINAVTVMSGSQYTIGDAGLLKRDGVVVGDLESLCNFLLPSGSMLLTGGQLGRLYNALDGQLIHQHRSPLNCGVSYKVGAESRALIGTYTGEVLVFSHGGSKLELVDVVQVHANAIKGVAESDGTVFSVCADASCAWMSAATHEVHHRVSKGHDRIANGCVGLRDGRFASISRDRKLRLWSGHTPRAYETPHPNSIKSVAIDSDKRFIASGSYAGHLSIFDIETESCVLMIRISSAGVSNIAYDAGSACFLASTYDGMIHTIHRSEYA